MSVLCVVLGHKYEIKCSVEDHPWQSTECFFAFRKGGPTHDIIGVCKRCDSRL